MYFDEDLVLDLRLNILNNHVDKFIIAEATRDHAGNNKKLNFNYNNFSKFKKKKFGRMGLVCWQKTLFLYSRPNYSYGY